MTFIAGMITGAIGCLIVQGIFHLIHWQKSISEAMAENLAWCEKYDHETERS